jgi:hypothetical protein
LTDEFITEVKSLTPSEGVGGYRASFTYCINGAPLRSGVYPPVTVLYRRAHAIYEQDGHTQRVRVDQPVMPLTSRILHDDRKPLSHWIASQVRYMRLEADKLTSAPDSSLATVDRVRKWIVLAAAVGVSQVLVRGWRHPGWMARDCITRCNARRRADPVVEPDRTAAVRPALGRAGQASRTRHAAPADGGAARG